MKSMSMQGLGSLHLKPLSNKVHLHHIRFVLFFCRSKLGVKVNFCAICVPQFIGCFMINLYSFLVILKMATFYPSFSVLCSWLLRVCEPKFCLTLPVLFVVAYIYHLHLSLSVSKVSLSVAMNDKFLPFC